MRLSCLSVQSSKEAWFNQAQEHYTKKIDAFCQFQLINLKAKSGDRKQKEFKKEKESQQILDKIDPRNFVVLCDERGKSFDSQNFSKKLVSWIELGHAEVVFVVGGAYGVSDELRKRANVIWSLSPMVMNHHVAQIVVLEQIYRGFAIWKGIPYHNE